MNREYTLILKSNVTVTKIDYKETINLAFLVVRDLLILLVLVFFLNFLFVFIWLCRVVVVGSLIFIAACVIFSCDTWTLSCSMWDLVPLPGIEPRPLHWKHGVLATRPPGKSLLVLFSSETETVWASCGQARNSWSTVPKYMSDSKKAFRWIKKHEINEITWNSTFWDSEAKPFKTQQNKKKICEFYFPVCYSSLVHFSIHCKQSNHSNFHLPFLLYFHGYYYLILTLNLWGWKSIIILSC